LRTEQGPRYLLYSVDQQSKSKDTAVAKALRARQALLTTSDVSKLLGIHRETLYQWIRDGRIPAMRIGRNLKFDPAALAVWLEARVAS
jgi:excisionase family DNA binding protein